MSSLRSVVRVRTRVPAVRAIAVLLLIIGAIAACGAANSDDVTEVEAAGQPVEATVDEVPQLSPTVEMIPVEPDGGIGDGAGPIPGTEDSGDTTDPDLGTWHGAQVAETNCPGTSFQRVEASVFSFSVPEDFDEQQVQPIDSEIGYWQNASGSIEVSFDYGWYSAALSSYSDAEVSSIDFGGFVGEQAVIRDSPDWPKPHVVGVHFGEVEFDEPQQWNALNLVVQHDDPADEIIGRCIVGSIEWKIIPAE